jgi:hypothetical protein
MFILYNNRNYMANNACFFIEAGTYAQTEVFGPISETQFKLKSNDSNF